LKNAKERQNILTSLQHSEAELLNNFQASQVLNDLLRISLKDISLQEKLTLVLDHLFSLPWLAFERRGSIFLLNERDATLEMQVQSGLAEPLLKKCAELPLGKCLCGKAAQRGEVVFADHVDHRHDVRYDAIKPHGHYCVPIKYNTKVVGVINVYTEEGHERSTDEERFLEGVADTVATMIVRSRMEEERKRLEESVRQGQKMEAIGTLAGGIAHDFNNILTSILGYAALIKDECQQESQMADDLEQILQAGNRAKELVRQILTFSRQHEKEPQLVQPWLIAKEALKLLRASIPAFIEIRSHISSDGCAIWGDPTRIHQLFMNLCTNAYQAMRQSGGLLDVSLGPVCLIASLIGEIGTLAAGEYVKLTVADTGIGMAPDIKKRIFEPYFSTKGAEDGTGLGLAVVYGAVAEMKGDIVVCSELGEGTTFEVYLPLAKEVRAESLISHETLPRGTEHILCVDDEQPIVEICRRTLEHLGYTVTALLNPADAIDAFRQQPDAFDLLLTDQAMPDITGLELIDILHGTREDLPVIISTGFSEQITEEIIREHRIDKLLLKPLLRTALAAGIREVLDGRKHD